MTLVQINWNPERKQLRGFGWICFVGCAAIGALVYFRHSLFGFAFSPAAAERTAWALWAAGLIAAGVGLVLPRALRPVFVGLSLITLPIGFVISHLIMALLFYGLFTPVGWVFKLIGRDPLHRRFDPEASSYWVRRAAVQDPKRYYRQF